MCLVELRTIVACVTSGSRSAGASPGLGDGHRVSISSRASHSRVTSARSAVVPSRRSPVTSSSMCVVMPSLVAMRRSPPRRRSWEGSRPASRTVRGTVLSAGLDHVPGEARGQRCAVHARPGRREQVDGPRRVVRDAHLLQHLERLLVDEFLLHSGEVGDAGPGHGASSLGYQTGYHSLTEQLAKSHSPCEVCRTIRRSLSEDCELRSASTVQRAARTVPVNARRPDEPYGSPGLRVKQIRRRPTLPRGRPRSTIGAGGLNFSVRNGKRCDPSAMAAENLAPSHWRTNIRAGTRTRT